MYKEDCPTCIGDGYYDSYCEYCDGEEENKEKENNFLEELRKIK